MLDGSASSPTASDVAMIDEDDFVQPVEDEPTLPVDVPMSDPAPSSPAAKVAERRTQPKMDADQYDDDDEEYDDDQFDDHAMDTDDDDDKHRARSESPVRGVSEDIAARMEIDV